mgnify:CR=1 FL=1
MAIASGAYKKALTGVQQAKEVLVRIDRVTKKFDETVAVDDVSLTINKGEIFALLFEQAKHGLAVLYVTSEVGEALTASHRIIVMRKGRIVREFDPRTASREEVMAASGEAAAEDLHQTLEGTKS